MSSERTNESNKIYKKEACVARKHLKKKEVMKTRGSEDHQKLSSSEALSSKPVYQKLTSLEVLKIIRSWKTGSFKILSNAIIFMPMYAEGMEAWSND